MHIMLIVNWVLEDRFQMEQRSNIAIGRVIGRSGESLDRCWMFLIWGKTIDTRDLTLGTCLNCVYWCSRVWTLSLCLLFIQSSNSQVWTNDRTWYKQCMNKAPKTDAETINTCIDQSLVQPHSLWEVKGRRAYACFSADEYIAVICSILFKIGFTAVSVHRVASNKGEPLVVMGKQSCGYTRTRLNAPYACMLFFLEGQRSGNGRLRAGLGD